MAAAIDQAAGGCQCPGTGTSCSPCTIPSRDLTLTYRDFSGTHAVPMPWNGLTGLLAQWRTGCFFFSSSLVYLICHGGVLELVWTDCLFVPTCDSQDPVFALSLIDFTCTPFHLHYRPAVACSLLGTILDIWID